MSPYKPQPIQKSITKMTTPTKVGEIILKLNIHHSFAITKQVNFGHPLFQFKALLNPPTNVRDFFKPA